MAVKNESALLIISEVVRKSIEEKTLHIDYPAIINLCREKKISSYTLHQIIERELALMEAAPDDQPTRKVGFVKVVLPERTHPLPPREEGTEKEVGTTEKLPVQDTDTEVVKKPSLFRRMFGSVRTTLLVIMVLGLIGLGFFFLYGSLNDTKKELTNAKLRIFVLSNEVNNLNEELDSTKFGLQNSRDEAQKKFNDLKDKVASAMPIIISGIEIANTDNSGDIETDYGNTIYSSNTMYLKPKISYMGIKSGENIKLDVKFYTPSGLSTGTSSPQGYSYSSSMDVQSGDNTEVLVGWGGSSRGHWKSGQYRFEIWYGDVCLKSKSFTIY